MLSLNPNGRQKIQLVIAAVSIVLLIVWFIIPGWELGKILGIIGDFCLLLCMIISYRAEEKQKNQSK